MATWEEHLPSLAMALKSAEELRGMGLQDGYILDDETGEVLQ
jgi:hypothetical protein